MNELRADLEPLPERMKQLPIDERGYVVPWFVMWVPGPEPGTLIPEFRGADTAKWDRALRQHLCWVCGGPLGVHLAFVIGPMCAVSRVTIEPACHRECAEWSIRNCPFLSRPQMVRRESGPGVSIEVLEAVPVPGVMIKRNPGVMVLWMTRDYVLVRDQKNGRLINIGAPDEVRWYTYGRPATRAEVEQAIATGIPLLLQANDIQSKEGVDHVYRQVENLRPLLPTV